ncbi:MAG: EutN/CcmL family microcompartment protein [Acidobacteriota bacterium]|nr:EutN/CcmL family microcompartment protein [Acidobacteriota bacterium]
MRLGIVKGTVVLGRGLAALEGTRYLIIEPLTSDDLKAGATRGSGREVVAADHLAPGPGQMVCFEEGREACAPWLPAGVPIDAYVSGIIDSISYQPAE